jgi:hypothetical protein
VWCFVCSPLLCISLVVSCWFCRVGVCLLLQRPPLLAWFLCSLLWTHTFDCARSGSPGGSVGCNRRLFSSCLCRFLACSSFLHLCPFVVRCCMSTLVGLSGLATPLSFAARAPCARRKMRASKNEDLGLIGALQVPTRLVARIAHCPPSLWIVIWSCISVSALKSLT